jgi:hypothetical protein
MKMRRSLLNKTTGSIEKMPALNNFKGRHLFYALFPAPVSGDNPG